MSLNVTDPLGKPVSCAMSDGQRRATSRSLAFVKLARWNCYFEKNIQCPFSLSLYTDSVCSLVTEQQSAHWDSYQWKLFKACAGACTVSHPSGLFPWQPLPPSTCGCWQPSERSPWSLKYHWQGQHPAGGKPLKHLVRFQRCGARKAPSLHWRWSRMAPSAPLLGLMLF